MNRCVITLEVKSGRTLDPETLKFFVEEAMKYEGGFAADEYEVNVEEAS